MHQLHPTIDFHLTTETKRKHPLGSGLLDTTWGSSCDRSNGEQQGRYMLENTHGLHCPGLGLCCPSLGHWFSTWIALCKRKRPCPLQDEFPDSAIMSGTVETKVTAKNKCLSIMREPWSYQSNVCIKRLLTMAMVVDCSQLATVCHGNSRLESKNGIIATIKLKNQNKKPLFEITRHCTVNLLNTLFTKT